MKLCERSLFRLPFFAIFVIVLFTLSTFEVGAQLDPLNIPNIPAEDQNYSILTNHSTDLDLTTLFNDVDQSVVQISENSASSLGSRQASGFVYDDLGHIVTNYHVVGNPQETNLYERAFHITFLDGTYIFRQSHWCRSLL